ncbi:MAG: LLM class F420-dependent oxidoreductase, partial [Deltaproteobacteria bacterium]|nr:LLM class F420-dependent oxidoreductase [Deltaproteobacteria bacterium]
VAFRDFYQKGPDPQALREKIDALRGFADQIIAKL